jgi:hypothetical protein
MCVMRLCGRRLARPCYMLHGMVDASSTLLLLVCLPASPLVADFSSGTCYRSSALGIRFRSQVREASAATQTIKAGPT